MPYPLSRLAVPSNPLSPTPCNPSDCLHLCRPDTGEDSGLTVGIRETVILTLASERLPRHIIGNSAYGNVVCVSVNHYPVVAVRLNNGKVEGPYLIATQNVKGILAVIDTHCLSDVTVESTTRPVTILAVELCRLSLIVGPTIHRAKCRNDTSGAVPKRTAQRLSLAIGIPVPIHSMLNLCLSSGQVARDNVLDTRHHAYSLPLSRLEVNNPISGTVIYHIAIANVKETSG